MKLDEVFPQLDGFSDDEADAIFSSAKSDRTYRLQLAGVFLGYVAAVGLVSLSIPALYRTYHPTLLVKLCLAGLVLLGIWQSVKFSRSIIEHFYCGAIIRQVHARTVGRP